MYHFIWSLWKSRRYDAFCCISKLQSYIIWFNSAYSSFLDDYGFALLKQNPSLLHFSSSPPQKHLLMNSRILNLISSSLWMYSQVFVSGLNWYFPPETGSVWDTNLYFIKPCYIHFFYLWKVSFTSQPLHFSQQNWIDVDE